MAVALPPSMPAVARSVCEARLRTPGACIRGLQDYADAALRPRGFRRVLSIARANEQRFTAGCTVATAANDRVNELRPTEGGHHFAVPPLHVAGIGVAPGARLSPPVTRIARKSLTFVRVGPVTTESPSAAKNACASLRSRSRPGCRPNARARGSVSGATIAPAVASAPS